MDEELDGIREKKRREIEERIRMRAEGNVLTVDQAGFSALVAAHPKLVIDFWAEWCGPCRMVSPAIEELAGEFIGQVTFAKCDTDQNQRLAVQFGISAIPTILLISAGQVVDRIVGAYPKDTIRRRILLAFGISE
jgi:thioredoxin 1